MPGSTFGHLYRLTSFGESHGEAIGGVIDGIPAGFDLDIDALQDDLNRRRPGTNSFSSPRKEADRLEILSGVFEGKTLGTPLAFMVRSLDARSKDYSHLKDLYRPSHADYTYEVKYGHRDYRGGGRSSARETIARVVAGSIAKQILVAKYGIKIYSYTKQIGTVIAHDIDVFDHHSIESSVVRCPSKETSEAMLKLLDDVKADGDSVGGVVSTYVKHLPAGIGEPVFDKLQAVLAHAMMSINATKGFSYGVGFNAAHLKGSEQNDPFVLKGGKVSSEKNYSGGIQGGISNGQDVYFDVAFKAVATIGKEQKTLNKDKEEVSYKAGGRHDVCIVPRAVPIVESMTAITLLDQLLIHKAYL
jgi:chorismate synthase